MTDEWPTDLRGITESIVSTPDPDGGYNVAALGLDDGEPVTAKTWGATRTRANVEREREGYVQFTRDPVAFVEAALTDWTADEPILESADAWVRVRVEEIESGTKEGTEWVQWALEPVESAVRRETVAVTNRGYAAVIEATVAASRLDVPAYDEARLAARLAYFADVIERCGGERERRAWERLEEAVALPELDSFESF